MKMSISRHIEVTMTVEEMAMSFAALVSNEQAEFLRLVEEVSREWNLPDLQWAYLGSEMKSPEFQAACEMVESWAEHIRLVTGRTGPPVGG